MGYFPVMYDIRVVIYERKIFIRLATGVVAELAERLFLFKKIGQPRTLFCLFPFFSNTILQKNLRLHRDSNSDRQSRR